MDLPLVGRISWLNIPTDEAPRRIQAPAHISRRVRNDEGRDKPGLRCSAYGAAETPQVQEYMLGADKWSMDAAGAGGRTRTGKGRSPEICGVSAFTSFATPAPLPAANPGNHEGETRDLTSAADRHDKGCHQVSVIEKTRVVAKSNGLR